MNLNKYIILLASSIFGLADALCKSEGIMCLLTFFCIISFIIGICN